MDSLIILFIIIYYTAFFFSMSESMFNKSEHCVSKMHWENSQIFQGGSYGNSTNAHAAHFLFAATNCNTLQ